MSGPLYFQSDMTPCLLHHKPDKHGNPWRGWVVARGIVDCHCEDGVVYCAGLINACFDLKVAEGAAR